MANEEEVLHDREGRQDDAGLPEAAAGGEAGRFGRERRLAQDGLREEAARRWQAGVREDADDLRPVCHGGSTVGAS